MSPETTRAKDACPHCGKSVGLTIWNLLPSRENNRFLVCKACGGHYDLSNGCRMTSILGGMVGMALGMVFPFQWIVKAGHASKGSIAAGDRGGGPLDRLRVDRRRPGSRSRSKRSAELAPHGRAPARRDRRPQLFLACFLSVFLPRLFCGSGPSIRLIGSCAMAEISLHGCPSRSRHARRRSRGLRPERNADGPDVVGPRSQRLDDDVDGAGAVHDAAGAGAVLRRARAPEEHPLGDGAVPRLRGAGDDPLVALRLQPGVQPRARRSSAA